MIDRLIAKLRNRALDRKLDAMCNAQSRTSLRKAAEVSIDYYVIRDPWVWAVILGLLFLAVCIRWSLW